MATISLYTFENAEGSEYGVYSTQDPSEAREYASRYGLRVVENVYEWSESVPVEGWDFTGADTEEVTEQ